MPTQRQILEDRLHESINKKAAKRSKNPPAAQKAKSVPGKENRAARASQRQAVQKAVKKPATIQWAKVENHPLTDQLLTIIEDKPRYRQAFGFSKEPGTNATTGGQTLVDLYTEVAGELLVSGEDSNFTEDDLPELQKVVSNRISALKKLYRDNRNELGQTGQGLVDSETTHEIEAGTHLANVWDRIKLKFPWYERLNKLFGTNPAIDRGAIANSQTTVDTSILGATSKKRKGRTSSRAKSPSVDSSSGDSGDESGSDQGISWSESDVGGGVGHGDESHDGGGDSGSDGGGDGGGGDSDDDGGDSDLGNAKPNKHARQRASLPPPAVQKPGRTSNRTRSGSLSKPASTPQSTKRKASVMEQITEMAHEDRSQRVKIVEVKQRGKTHRSRVKYTTQNDLEMARLKHQESQSALQREHDLAMMDRQMEVERIRAAAHAHFPPGHYRGPDPAATGYGLPLPHHAIDPNLRNW
ncbi:hypothetical protein GALMADRAFT_222736 [Galerina marginata CBS 339.88]|uniref:Uncharacterized protein n=1 Tax=Galerina marginata (strain CBS 339.88) TaxID=685588 RepID=A0A067TDJ9_GALM3|nr:hypothetical protein GALMADRAFT_222736 [Galerina marginata CBS 339.88]